MKKTPKPRTKYKETTKWDDESLAAKDAINKVARLLGKLGYKKLHKLHFDHWEFTAKGVK